MNSFRYPEETMKVRDFIIDLESSILNQYGDAKKTRSAAVTKILARLNKEVSDK